MQRRGLFLKDAEQRLPAHSAEAVTRAAHNLPTVVDVDVVPVHEMSDDRGIRLLVGALNLGNRRIAEDDAEAERVVWPVLLQNEDLVRRVGSLHEDGEVEAGRPAPDDRDPHEVLPGIAVVASTPLQEVRVPLLSKGIVRLAPLDLLQLRQQLRLGAHRERSSPSGNALAPPPPGAEPPRADRAATARAPTGRPRPTTPRRADPAAGSRPGRG